MKEREDRQLHSGFWLAAQPANLENVEIQERGYTRCSIAPSGNDPMSECASVRRGNPNSVRRACDGRENTHSALITQSHPHSSQRWLSHPSSQDTDLSSRTAYVVREQSIDHHLRSSKRLLLVDALPILAAFSAFTLFYARALILDSSPLLSL